MLTPLTIDLLAEDKPKLQFAIALADSEGGESGDDGSEGGESGESGVDPDRSDR